VYQINSLPIRTALKKREGTIANAGTLKNAQLEIYKMFTIACRTNKFGHSFLSKSLDKNSAHVAESRVIAWNMKNSGGGGGGTNA
jgi:hypothetical protein